MASSSRPPKRDALGKLPFIPYAPCPSHSGLPGLDLWSLLHKRLSGHQLCGKRHHLCAISVLHGTQVSPVSCRRGAPSRGASFSRFSAPSTISHVTNISPASCPRYDLSRTLAHFSILCAVCLLPRHGDSSRLTSSIRLLERHFRIPRFSAPCLIYLGNEFPPASSRRQAPSRAIGTLQNSPRPCQSILSKIFHNPMRMLQCLALFPHEIRCVVRQRCLGTALETQVQDVSRKSRLN